MTENLATSLRKGETLLTGKKIIIPFQIFSILVFIGLLIAFLSDSDPLPLSDNKTLVFVFFAIYQAIVFLSLVLACTQRLKLDLTGQRIAYANLGTLHRWKYVDVKSIERIYFGHTSRADIMIHKLHLMTHPLHYGEIVMAKTLIDSRSAPFASREPSELFVSVIEFVKNQNPKVKLPDSLNP